MTTSFPVRPPAFPNWCASGATNITQPTSAQVAVGWNINSSPPSSYMNWLQQLQEQWIQYFGWKTSLDYIVKDDFVQPATAGYTGYGSSGYVPWFTFVPGGGAFVSNPAAVPAGIVTSNPFFLLPAGIMGVLGLTSGFTSPGYLEFYQFVDAPAGRDFSMEFIVADQLRGIVPFVPGASVEMGLIYPHSGMSGANPLAAFMWTGPSGYFAGFRWQPSGSAPTMLSLGLIPNASGTHAGQSGFHKYTVENRGPTMALYIDDALIGAAPSPGALGTTGLRMAFGARVGAATGFSFAAAGIIFDKAELKVARTLV